MKHFKKLVIRLQTLNLAIAPVDSPSSIDGGYPSVYSLVGQNPHKTTKLSLEMESLRQKAILDISILQGWQILELLKKLYFIQVKFEIFWERYYENIKEEGLEGWDEYCRSLMIDQFFLIHNLGKDNQYQFDLSFFIDLRESLQWREDLLLEVIQEMENLIPADIPSETEETDPEEQTQPPVNSSPLFAANLQQDILTILCDFFVPEDREGLQVLVINRISPAHKLTFQGSGNQLADAFKQLIEANLITGVSKRKLEQWITERFQYQVNNTIRSFTPRYLNGIISSESRLCQSPILDIRSKDGRLFVVPLIRNKKTQKNR